jgi:hypothetical protein
MTFQLESPAFTEGTTIARSLVLLLAFIRCEAVFIRRTPLPPRLDVADSGL